MKTFAYLLEDDFAVNFETISSPAKLTNQLRTPPLSAMTGRYVVMKGFV